MQYTVRILENKGLEQQHTASFNYVKLNNKKLREFYALKTKKGSF